MAYVEVAYELAARVFRFVTRMPKRYDHRIGNPLFEHAEEVVFHAEAANGTYVRDDDSFARRRAHLDEAGNHLTHVESLLGIAHELTCQLANEGECRPPSDAAYREFARLIERERKLIAGCKRRDTQAYNGRRAAAPAESPVN